MELRDAVLVTIVAERVLEQRLLDDIAVCGARGWTVTEARGQGPRARRVSDLEGGNVRIEAVVSQAVCDAIVTVLDRDYFPNYAVCAWVTPAQVVREDRLR